MSSRIQIWFWLIGWRADNNGERISGHIFGWPLYSIHVEGEDKSSWPGQTNPARHPNPTSQSIVPHCKYSYQYTTSDLMTMTCSFTCAFESNHPAPAMQFPRQLHDGDRPNRTCQPRHVVEEQRFFYGRCRLVTTFLIHDEMEIWRCGRSIPYKMCEFVILLAFASPCIVRSIGSIQFM